MARSKSSNGSSTSAERKFLVIFIHNLHSFLHLLSIFSDYLPLLHILKTTLTLFFTVACILDPEPTPDDEIFQTQARFIIGETQPSSDPSDIEDNANSPAIVDIQARPLNNTPVNGEDDVVLSQAQNNLLNDLTKHKIQLLKHDELSTKFSMLSNSSSLPPKYTLPDIKLVDKKFFSHNINSRFLAMNTNYQRDLCALLSDHHKEMAERERLIVQLRLDTISKVYNDRKLLTHMDSLSKDASTEAFINDIVIPKRVRRAGEKRPRE